MFECVYVSVRARVSMSVPHTASHATALSCVMSQIAQTSTWVTACRTMAASARTITSRSSAPKPAACAHVSDAGLRGNGGGGGGGEGGGVRQ